MKIGFLSLGCPKNVVDGEVMLGMVRDAGHDITPDASDADVLVVNTCAFIDSAKQESIDAILEMAGHKRDGKCSRLVVTGCLAERYRDELRKEIPEIDAVLGTGEVPEILDAIEPRLSLSGVRSFDSSIARELAQSGVRSVDSSIARRTGNSQGRMPDSSPDPNAALPLKFVRSSDLEFRGSSNNPSEPRAIELPNYRATGGRQPEPRAIELPNYRTIGTRQRPTYIYDAETPRLLTTPKHFAYVKIAEGCDYTCAFCIIPTLRGAYRSRTADSIVREARALADRGVRELLLVSQDTTFYGIDHGERGALARLLRELNRIEGLTWIRLLYLYPTTITDDVLDAMAECDKVCRYVDLPLQHASASVLKRMRRPGNRRTYDRLLARIRARVPGVALRTTLIVGFPGETAADFAELEGFVADTGFDHVGVFTYSHEEGTRAFDLPDDVPAALKRRRRQALMAHQKRIVAARHRSRIGDEIQVLIDGPSPEHELVLQGRLEGQAPEIDPVVFLTDCDAGAFQPGDLVRASVRTAKGYDLVAAPLG